MTGGIGSGKSAALGMLKKMGHKVLSADGIYRKLLLTDQGMRNEIRSVFGCAVFHKNGRLDRSRLAKVVFADPAMRRKLNGITHPKIENIISGTAKGSGGHVFVEVPLLYEEKLENRYDMVLLITAKKNIRIKRLRKRGLSPGMIKKRIESQLGEDRKAALADRVIENNKTIGDLKKSLESFVGRLR
ncbi:MAG: dephospho-CoA kinase [Lentisphaerae bacterium GWF2_52_8]|nr:MAG: dephospho-CoA kinase [Lentisphaerae bacterium GWF2_52_8]